MKTNLKCDNYILIICGVQQLHMPVYRHKIWRCLVCVPAVLEKLLVLIIISYFERYLLLYNDMSMRSCE